LDGLAAAREGPPPRAAGARDAWLLGAIVLVAAALRLWGLASLPFEQDELYTLRDAADLGASSGVGPGILGRPLYYLLQRLLLGVLPADPAFLRAPALLFGIAGVVATWWAVRRLVGPTGALAAALLVALSPWHLYHSQFARYWTLVYLLATVAFAYLPAALRGSGRAAVGFVVAALAGALSHPTFLFALAGAAIGATVVSDEGGVRVPLPSARSITRIWIPLLAPLAAWFAVVRFLDGGRGLRNPGGAAADGGLRVFAGMIQWLGPTVAAAAALGIVALWTRFRHRRVAAMCAGGILSMVGLLFLAGTRTAVYADYGTAALPLVFLAAGAAVELAAVRIDGRAGWAFAAVVIAGLAPQTVSHLRDGTRFDFRPAHAAIRAEDPAAAVVAWPIIVHRHYASDLRVVEADGVPETYERLLADEGGFWMISAVRRRGVVPGGRAAEAWIDGHCRREERWETGRLDFRRYAVELAWCETTPRGP
jgi:predicted membrane-bound mannosyltransferase